ncbi:MAG: prepilin-type N-terminal cleavage/methylation domain-containing protein [Planctomycetaceae bacterium]|nr:prepilin-type N-terminal cleavage/methylation domain-containing protein [Planctomycetaceae bacterium]
MLRGVPIVNYLPTNRRRTNRGLTLLELLLALALTSLIMAVIAMSLDIYMRTLDRRQAIIEESQLARAILQQIANDLRSAVQVQTGDVEEGLAGLDGIDLAGGVGDLLGGDIAGDLLGGGDTGLEDLLMEEDMAVTDDLATSMIPPAVPGLYGNQYQLQMDISRLPRVEEYQRLMNLEDNFALTDIPSDVKTITYYVQGQDMVSMESMAEELDVVEDDIRLINGLVRRNMDRAVTQFAADNGNTDALLNQGDVIAPEVVSIEFQYWDGLLWLPEWDSEVEESLPVAVEIRLYLKSARNNQSSSMLSAFSLGDDMDELETGTTMYRLVVRLPVGKFDIEADPTNEFEAMGL